MSNLDNIIKRIAVSLDTTKKYLYFIGEIPSSFETDDVVQVENLLETILKAEDFESLYENIKEILPYAKYNEINKIENKKTKK